MEGGSGEELLKPPHPHRLILTQPGQIERLQRSSITFTGPVQMHSYTHTHTHGHRPKQEGRPHTHAHTHTRRQKQLYKREVFFSIYLFKLLIAEAFFYQISHKTRMIK